MKGLLLTIPALLFIIMLAAQQANVSVIPSTNKKIDSLLLVLKNAKPDTNKVVTLYELSILLHRNNTSEDIMKYASEALAISQKENYKWGIGISYYVMGFYEYAKRNYEQALNNISNAEQILGQAGDKKNTGRSMYLRGNILFDMGNYSESIKVFTSALETWQAIGYKALTGSCSLDLAISYSHLGNYSKGIEYSYKALQVSEELGDKKVMAQSLHFIGALFYGFGDYESAMKNFRAASAIYLELGNKFDFARNNNMIGEVLLNQGNCTGAHQKFYQSLKIYEEPGAPAWGAPWGYSCIGSVYEKWGDSANAAGGKTFAINKYKEALNNYTISLKKFEEIEDPAGTAERKIFIGRIHFKLGQLSIAKKYLLDGLKISGKFEEKLYLESGYLCLSQIDSAEGNAWKAYEHYKLFALYRDSIFNRESSQKLSIYKVQYEVDKKDQEIKLLSAENKLKTVESEKEAQRKKFAYAAIGVVLLLSGYAFYRYRRFSRNKSEQKTLHDRLQISQDLHDNVGSTLSSISVFSKVAQVQGQQNNKEEMQEVLGRISDTSHEMVSEMNDIVWAINPKNDSMERIIQRMESFAKPMLATRNIIFNLNYEPTILSASLDMGKRKNFYLIFKEAINNAFKYSGCSEINAEITNSNRHLELRIKDNGVGFDVQREIIGDKLTLSGNGLRNMKARAEEMKGELRVNSISGEGTEVSVVFPIS